MKILVTGGTGFIGNHVYKKLVSGGHQVTTLSLSPSGRGNHVQLDLTGLGRTRRLTKNFDVVVHLAGSISVGEALKNPKLTIKNNVLSTLNMLEDIRHNNKNCFFILVSSEKVYGTPSKKEVQEDDRLDPIDPYGYSKVLSEQVTKMYSKSYGIKYAILRPASVFGPAQSPSLFVPYIITSAIKGDKIKVGDLSAVRNFLYVDDLVDAISLFVENKHVENKTFNLMGFTSSISDIAKEVSVYFEKVQGRKITFMRDEARVRPSSAETNNFLMNCHKAQKLGWSPKFGFKGAIKSTIDWYLNKGI